MSDQVTETPIPRRRRRRSRVLLGAGLAAVVVAAAGVAAFGIDLSNPEPASSSGLPPATGTVTRMTLTETEKVNGTLGYGDATTVSGRGGGTVTWLPASGSTVERGKPVYRRDDKPVPLLYGTLPMYRVLRNGSDGSDVKQLEENLAALGYKGFTVDTSFSGATADAVRAWQDDLGLTQTGTVDPGQVVVAPAAIRVATLRLAVGDPANGPVLTYTGLTREVDINLDVAKQHLVKSGISATVTLPDNSTVEGLVSTVGTVATTSPGTGQNQTTTIEVVVTVADQKALGTLDAAPVTVTLVSDRRENVLTVPVAALVALAEGGYGVQVIEGGTAHYVAVQTGMFGNGRVEISGSGIAEGTVVGLPT
jgi:peptidoglycan hydrolase-like protein with peptidoglycan-binding domain